MEHQLDKPSAYMTTSALGNQKIPVVSFTGQEGLNELSRFQIEVEMMPDTAKLQDLLLADVKLEIEAWTGTSETVEPRTIEGIISSANINSTGVDFGQWTITLSPTFWRLTQKKTSRVFQEMSAKDIISTVLGDDGLTNFEFKLNGASSVEPRNYCVQYGETDYQFVLRLIEEEGLFYSINYGETETVVIRDSLAKLPDSHPLREVPWEVSGGSSVSNLEKVYGIMAHGLAQPEKTIVRDFNYESPSVDLTAEGKVKKGVVGDWHMYREAGFSDIAGGENLSKIASERNEGAGYYLQVSTNCRSLAAGTLFKIIQGESFHELPFGVDEASLAILGCSSKYHHGQYSNTVDVRASDQPYRALRQTSKPRILGPQTAFVVGTQSEVETEPDGRIKVQFHWDKTHAGETGKTSCWIRVAQGFAGEDHGAYFVPKIGDEVVVIFEDGDPDRPLVIGSVYNAVNKCPLDIGPQDKRMMLHTTEGFTAYVEDNADSGLEMYMGSTSGQHDFTFYSGKEINVEAEDKISVKGNKTTDLQSVKELTVLGDQAIKVTGKNNITIEGKGSGTITVSQGSGKITIDPAGNVKIVGLNIDISASAILTLKGALVKIN